MTNSSSVDTSALNKLSYGLFVLTTKDGEKDNGCIINTAMQITSTPLRVSIAVNKANFTHNMIAETGAFNISTLSTSTPFDTFTQFGFSSGKDKNKFANVNYDDRSANGLRYIPKYSNSVISAKVCDSYDCGTHTLFIADVTESFVLSNKPSATYQYYFDHIKPKPQSPVEKKKGFICKICGYIYEGDILPDDFICPICKHGAVDFEVLI